MRSLFLVSLPRSLSSLLFQAIRDALGLTEPVWTSDGEVLNLHRYALMPTKGAIDGIRFLRRADDPTRFDRLLTFLDQATVREGFLYKDVVHPFVMAEWLPVSGLAALRIERPLADVAFAMLERGWLYPRSATEPVGDPERELLTGLVRGHQALASLPAPVVHFDELIYDEEPLTTALRTLYGDDVSQPHYLDDSFRAMRDEVTARRRTERYLRLAEMVEAVETENLL
jgi:hypothetical protein